MKPLLILLIGCLCLWIGFSVGCRIGKSRAIDESFDLLMDTDTEFRVKFLHSLDSTWTGNSMLIWEADTAVFYSAFNGDDVESWRDDNGNHFVQITLCRGKK